MAQTDSGAITAMQKKDWELKCWKAGRDASFFFSTGLMGSGDSDSNKPIHYVKELTKTSRGDKCVMHLVPDIPATAIAGDNRMKGKERAFTLSTQEIQLDQIRNAIRSAGKMSEQKTVVRFRETAKDQLGNWSGQLMDDLAFLTASGRSYSFNTDGSSRIPGDEVPSLAFAAGVTAPSTNRKFFAGGVASEAALSTAEKMTWSFIVSAVAYAKRKRLKPVRYQGRSKYPIVMSTEEARDLKKDPDYMTNVGRAGGQGSKNPLFTGMFADIDDAILFDHNKVRNTLGAASGSKFGASGTVDGAQALLLGAQALAFARIGNPEYVEDNDDDYGNQDNIGMSMQVGFLKPVYQSIYDNNANEDFSVISLYTAASPTAS